MHKQKVIISVGLIAVEIILLITGFGEISNGSLSITILHIPVILAAILLGLPYGGILGGIFGIGTMVAASGYGAIALAINNLCRCPPEMPPCPSEIMVCIPIGICRISSAIPAISAASHACSKVSCGAEIVILE